jgi:hypothetical protein
LPKQIEAVQSVEKPLGKNHGFDSGLMMVTNPYGFNDADHRLAGKTDGSAGSTETGSGKPICGPGGWQPDYDMSHPAVQKWHADAIKHASDPLDIDCHGMITVHNPDCLEELARKALIQVDHKGEAGYKPKYQEILDEEQKFIDANKAAHPTIDCNKHFIGEGWQLRVPGAPDNCGPTETERRTPPPPAHREPERRTERRPPQGRGPGVEIINEPGGVINMDDCAPCTTPRRRPPEAPRGNCPTCYGPSPTWRDPQAGASEYYPDTRLQGRPWVQNDREQFIPGGVPFPPIGEQLILRFGLGQQQRYRHHERDFGQWDQGNRQWDQGNRQWDQGNRQWDQGNRQWDQGNRQWDQGNRQWDQGNRQWDQGNRQWDQGNRQWDQGNGQWVQLPNGRWINQGNGQLNQGTGEWQRQRMPRRWARPASDQWTPDWQDQSGAQTWSGRRPYIPNSDQDYNY